MRCGDKPKDIMAKTYRTNYKPAHTSRKIYSGYGIESIFNLGLGHDGSGYHGHGNHRYLRKAPSKMLRARLKEETKKLIEEPTERFAVK